MAMHVVLGNGEMTRKELTETLKDLWEKAGDQPFWFVVQGKSEPTDTDANIVKWLHTNEVYYEVVTDDADAMADIYEHPQEVHVAKRLGQKIVSLLNSKPEDDESADVLALFASEDPDAVEDRWLNSVLQATVDAGFTVYALNDGLVEVDLSESAEDKSVEEEPEPVKPAPSKSASKRGAAKPKEDAAAVVGTYTRAQLERMELPELKEIAAKVGIELPSRTRMGTYIDAILGEGKEAPSVEITPPVSVSGDGDIDLARVAEEAAAIVIERIVAALQS